jgi:CDP-6-deoxy-D-xylo-4-hexulose-3-dehydrase
VKEMSQEILKQIEQLVDAYYSHSSKEVSGNQKIIRTSDVLFDKREVMHVLKVLLSGWISQGPETKQFEKEFADYYGVKHAITVNSGSSANLVALASLTHESLGENRIKPGDEVITSPVTFPTSMFPIIQVGAVPVFVDVDFETLCMDVEILEKAISKKTKAILPVHLLGHPCDMDKLPKDDYFLIEDACESHGSEYNGRKVGTFGDLGTFSFFTAHHMTTAEGGMVVTNDDRLADLAQSIKAFGRVIEVAKDPHSAQTLGVRYRNMFPSLGQFDIRQTFDKLGYALKMTDVQAAMGIEQLRKLDRFIEARRNNALYLKKQLEPYSDLVQLPVERPWAKHTYHHFSIIVKEDAPFSRFEIVDHLEKNGIETRPIEAGNMLDQPCMQGLNYRVAGSVKFSELIRKNGFFIACHPGLTRDDLEYMADTATQFLEQHKTR